MNFVFLQKQVEDKEPGPTPTSSFRTETESAQRSQGQDRINWNDCPAENGSVDAEVLWGLGHAKHLEHPDRDHRLWLGQILGFGSLDEKQDH